jgi:hypothetical protein
MVLANHVQLSAHVLGRALHAREDVAVEIRFDGGIEHRELRWG